MIQRVRNQAVPRGQGAKGDASLRTKLEGDTLEITLNEAEAQDWLMGTGRWAGLGKRVTKKLKLERVAFWMDMPSAQTQLRAPSLVGASRAETVANTGIYADLVEDVTVATLAKRRAAGLETLVSYLQGLEIYPSRLKRALAVTEHFWPGSNLEGVIAMRGLATDDD